MRLKKATTLSSPPSKSLEIKEDILQTTALGNKKGGPDETEISVWRKSGKASKEDECYLE